MLALGSAAHAGPPTWPTPEDIARAQREHPFPGVPQLETQPVRQPPKVSPAPAAIDLEALARRHPVATPDTTRADSTNVRVFVTLAMPRTSLEQLIDQAERAHAVLVLRGLKGNSMRQTVAAVQRLVGNRRVAWTIDPEAFTRYGVTLAPTVVLDLSTGTTPGCRDACRDQRDFLSVSGDVSLDYALAYLRRQRPQHAARIDPLLARLQAR